MISDKLSSQMLKVGPLWGIKLSKISCLVWRSLSAAHHCALEHARYMLHCSEVHFYSWFTANPAVFNQPWSLQHKYPVLQTLYCSKCNEFLQLLISM